MHARAGLRRILGEHLGVAASEIEIANRERGKPFLPDYPRLGFNLSHSVDHAAVVLTDGLRVGVDIEDASHLRRFEDLAGRFFAPEEQAWLRAGPVDRWGDRFYRIWTNKEAYVKALGIGFGLSPQRYALCLDDLCAARLLYSAAPDASTDRWRFETHDVGGGFLASTCVQTV
jgi:4'-phosphopantetheinyl transferase